MINLKKQNESIEHKHTSLNLIIFASLKLIGN